MKFRFIYNTAWLIADKIIHLTAGFLIGVYVARYLGPDKYGVLQFSLSFATIFGVLAKLGLDSIIVRNIVREPDKRDDLLGTAFGIQVLTGIIMLGVVFGAIKYMGANIEAPIIVMIFALGNTLQFYTVIESFFRSQVQGKLVSIANTTGLLTGSVFKLFLVFVQASIIWFAWAFVIEIFIKGLAFFSLYIRQRLSFTNWRFKYTMAKSLISDSWPLILSGIAVTIYMRIDQVMIKSMLDNRSVGNYAVAVNLSEAWTFITIAITQSLMPAIIKARSISKHEFKERIFLLYKFLITIALLISAINMILADWIINTLFGEQYFQAAPIFKVYVWSTVFVFMNNASWQWYIAENLQRIAFYRLFFGAICNIICNYFFIRHFGTLGAAWATIISYSLAAYFGNLFSKKTFVNFKLLTVALLSIFNLKGYSKLWN